jgi:hypothetical protein
MKTATKVWTPKLKVEAKVDEALLSGSEQAREEVGLLQRCTNPMLLFTVERIHEEKGGLITGEGRIMRKEGRAMRREREAMSGESLAP